MEDIKNEKIKTDNYPDGEIDNANPEQELKTQIIEPQPENDVAQAQTENLQAQKAKLKKPEIEYAGDYVITQCGYIERSEYNHKIYAYNNYLKQENSKKNSADMRIPLILAVISVILSVVGLGLPFGAVGLILAYNRQRVKKSQTLRWAKNIAITGILMNVFIIVCFVIALILPK